jgi:hypothetical protein
MEELRRVRSLFRTYSAGVSVIARQDENPNDMRSEPESVKTRAGGP